jgi:periplasmic protein TonB
VLDVTDEDRLEPVLGPAVALGAESGREPTISFVTPEQGHSGARAQPASLESKNTDRTNLETGDVHGFRAWPSGPSRNDQPPGQNERWWVRLRGPVGSLVLHLLPLLLLINWPMSPPAETEPIPVQLVFEPPPKAVAAPPQPQPKPTPPPPRGRLASEDVGEPEAKEVDKPKGDPPAAEKPAKDETPPAETEPPEKPQQMAAIAPPPLPQAKPDAPKPDPVPKPAPKPTPAAHQVPRRVEDPGNLAPHRARFPGPAATRDEYLAYMHSLIRQHYNLLTHAALGDRRGMTVVEFVVLDDGKIALVKVRRSSGYPDIDSRVAEMIEAVGHFPPLPQWFQGLAMPFEFGFPFPEALRE